MTYREFTQCILSEVKNLCKSTEEAVLNRVVKNNSVVLTGICIRDKGEKVTPSIYLEAYYERYAEGDDFAAIAKEIYLNSARYKKDADFDIEGFFDYEVAREGILFKIINHDRNMELIKDAPHRDILDLSVVYYYSFLTDVKGSIPTTLIHMSHMNMWNVSENDLYEAAISNMKRLKPAKLKVLTDVLREARADVEEYGEECPLMVLNSEDGILGAYWAFDKDMAGMIAEKTGSFYILPSSIHETIILPFGAEENPAILEKTVREINATQLNPEEVLSDNVYLYDETTKNIIIPDKTVVKEDMIIQ